MNVVIILPTYNEKGNIERLIEVLLSDIFPKIKNHKMFILVADDNSPDGTGEVVKKLMKKWANVQITQGEKKGLGAAYIRAMTYAVEKMDADVMFEMDADLQHDPHKVIEFLKKIDEGYHMVIGTRYSDGGSIPKRWGLHRKAFSIIGNLLVRVILTRYAIHDWTGGFRAIRKEVFLKEKEELTAFRGYTFQVSFLHKAARDGYKIAEVPFSFNERYIGNSKIAPKEYIIDLLEYLFKARLKEIIYGSFGKFLVVGGVGFVLHAIILRTLVEGFHVSPAPASLVGAVVAIFSNYNFNNLWTFRKDRAHTVFGYFFKMANFYGTSSFGVIVIQTGTVALGDYLFGRQWYFWYFIFGTGLLLVWNYTMYRKFIWRRKVPIPA